MMIDRIQATPADKPAGSGTVTPHVSTAPAAVPAVGPMSKKPSGSMTYVVQKGANIVPTWSNNSRVAVGKS